MGGREGGWRLRESRPKFVNSFVCACRVHCGCYTPPHTSTQPARDVYYSTRSRRPAPVFSSLRTLPRPPCAPHAFPHPSLSTTLERFTSLRASPRLARSFLFLTLCRNLSSPLARGATSDALCRRRVVAAAASIPRLSRFRLGCRRGSCRDGRPPDAHPSLGTSRNARGKKLILLR